MHYGNTYVTFDEGVTFDAGGFVTGLKTVKPGFQKAVAGDYLSTLNVRQPNEYLSEQLRFK
jgi:hypothetical protein